MSDILYIRPSIHFLYVFICIRVAEDDTDFLNFPLRKALGRSLCRYNTRKYPNAYIRTHGVNWLLRRGNISQVELVVKAKQGDYCLLQQQFKTSAVRLNYGPFSSILTCNEEENRKKERWGGGTFKG